GAVALGTLALKLAGAADRGRFFAGALLARLLIVAAQLHLAIHPLALQLLLERAEGLLDIVIANHDLHKLKPPLSISNRESGRDRRGIHHSRNPRNKRRIRSGPVERGRR